MNILTHGQPEADPKKTTPIQHVTLEGNGIFQVPQAYRRLQVLSGTAWVAFAGKDIILSWGQEILLPKNHYTVVISALGRDALELALQKEIC